MVEEGAASYLLYGYADIALSDFLIIQKLKNREKGKEMENQLMSQFTILPINVAPVLESYLSTASNENAMNTTLKLPLE